MQKRCKPYGNILLNFYDWKCIISLKPQQIWEYSFIHGEYVVTRGNVTIKLTEKEFNKYYSKIA